MKKVLLFNISLILFACNDAGKTNASNTVSQSNQSVPDEIERELTVSMEFKTNKEDEFVIMMNDIRIDDFQTKNIHIKERVSPTTSVDKLTGNFGVNNISNKLIISLGREEVKEVEIISMNFEYDENIVSVRAKDFRKYFGFSKFSVFDTITNKIQTIKINNIHNPRLYVKKKLWDELNVKF